MKNILKSQILLAILIAVIAVSYTYAGEGWEANLIITIANTYNNLSFGQREDASDSIDGKYDVIALLSGDIKAYFIHKEGSFWRDIKSTIPEGVRIWNIRVESELKGEIVTIEWSLKKLPETGIILKDNGNGTVINMKEGNSYSYQNEGTREFTIEITY